MTQQCTRRPKWTRLRDLRLGVNLTRAALAAEMGITYGHMGRVEQCTNRPGDALLIRLAERFGMTAAELLATRPGAPDLPASTTSEAA